MLIDICLHHTGDINTKKFNNYFVNAPLTIRQKYVNWVNIRKLEITFGNDERSAYWKTYEFINVTKYSFSNSLVMECQNHYIIEFLGAQMGPIYIYNREIFEKHIVQWLRQSSNSELRSLLYQTRDQYALYRKAHLGYWQADVSATIRKYNITHRISNLCSA